MEEDGLRICVICKKIFPDDEGLIKHKKAQHPQIHLTTSARSSDNTTNIKPHEMSNPFRNNSLTITKVNGESSNHKKGLMSQNMNRFRKTPASAAGGASSHSMNDRRAEMRMKQVGGKGKASLRSPPVAVDVEVDDKNTNWQKWVQRDPVPRGQPPQPPTNSSDGTIITPSAAERATSAFYNSAPVERTGRERVVGNGKAQSGNFLRKDVPHLIRMNQNNGKRPIPGAPTQRPSPVPATAGSNSTAKVPDIMQNLGKMRSIIGNPTPATPKLISPLATASGGTTVKKSVASAAKQAPVQAFRMGKPPQVPKAKGKILPRNAYNNALPKPGMNQAPPHLHLETELMDYDDDEEDDLFPPPKLVSEPQIGKKSAPPPIPKSGTATKPNNVGGKAPTQKSLSADRFAPITTKKSAPPPAASASRNGNSSGSEQLPVASSAPSKSAVTNGTKSQTKQTSEPVIVAKKSQPKGNTQEDKMKKMKMYVPTMPGTDYDMPSLSAVGSYTNRNGQQVWVCLVCNEKEQEESSRDMICCDTCEDWYHWGCVGIFSSVPEDDPWYCKRCIFQTSRNPRRDFPKLFKSNVPP